MRGRVSLLSFLPQEEEKNCFNHWEGFDNLPWIQTKNGRADINLFFAIQSHFQMDEKIQCSPLWCDIVQRR